MTDEMKRPSEAIVNFLAVVWSGVVAFWGPALLDADAEVASKQVAAVGNMITASAFFWSWLVDRRREKEIDQAIEREMAARAEVDALASDAEPPAATPDASEPPVSDG